MLSISLRDKKITSFRHVLSCAFDMPDDLRLAAEAGKRTDFVTHWHEKCFFEQTVANHMNKD